MGVNRSLYLLQFGHSSSSTKITIILKYGLQVCILEDSEYQILNNCIMEGMKGKGLNLLFGESPCIW